MKQDYVSHSGVITQVSDNTLTIRTDGSCSCDGCAVASLCNKDSSSGGDLLLIETPRARTFSVGQRIEAFATSGSTLRATWWALILPVILFVGAILLVRLLWPGSGAWSLLVGFILLALYDLLLYKMRKRLAQKIIWNIRPINQSETQQ